MRLRPDHALTPGPPHVRDGADLQRVMRSVLVALAPCVVFGLYNTGFQANRALLSQGLDPGAGWRERVLAALGAGHDPALVFDCALLGALHFVPLLAVALAVGGLWEWIFARARRRHRVPGLAVTAWLFSAALPPSLAWWQAALGISLAIVVGKEIFGGTGRNVFNPAVVGLAFLSFAYPADLRGDAVWIAVDGASAPTALRVALAGGSAALAEQGVSWWDAALGRVPGGLADTSALGCLLGALVLVRQRVASWRVMLGVALGATAAGAALPGPSWSWHLVLGSLAFGGVFFATDPVTAASTDAGRWVYGLLIGFLVVLIRVANPLQAEGVLLAILLGNTVAPLIDHGVVALHARRRRRRLACS